MKQLVSLPIFTIPWLVSSQHDWSLRAAKLFDCLDEKNPKAASVTWYACRLNSFRAGNIWATAPTASSATFMQSLRVSDTILGVRHAHRPASVISLHPISSNCQTPCNNFDVVLVIFSFSSNIFIRLIFYVQTIRFYNIDIVYYFMYVCMHALYLSEFTSLKTLLQIIKLFL